MAKPTLLILLGYGWAASSPLAYSLQRTNKYSHGGYTKQFSYLERTTPVSTERPNKLQYHKRKVLSNTWENFESHMAHKMNLTIDMEPLRDYPLEVFGDFCDKPWTLDKYINYYLALWDTVKHHGYKAVADYSGYSWRDKNVREFENIGWDRLKENFNLKGIFITRDPVRRAFSELISRRAKQENPEGFLGEFLKELGPVTKDDDMPTDLEDVTPYAKDYVRWYDLARSKMPDTQMFSMEELWEGSGKELKRLSEFLDYPITELYHNCYSPDVGHHIKFDVRVPCQYYGQADVELTPEMYRKYKKQLQWVYDKYANRFGIFPRYWGRPINYENNL